MAAASDRACRDRIDASYCRSDGDASIMRQSGAAAAVARPRRPRRLLELTGDATKVVSIADLRAPEFGVRFSGVAASVPDALVEAGALIAAGKLHILVEKSYTLAEAARAHIDSQAGHTRGRRVILV